MASNLLDLDDVEPVQQVINGGGTILMESGNSLTNFDHKQPDIGDPFQPLHNENNQNLNGQSNVQHPINITDGQLQNGLPENANDLPHETEEIYNQVQGASTPDVVTNGENDYAENAMVAVDEFLAQLEESKSSDDQIQSAEKKPPQITQLAMHVDTPPPIPTRMYNLEDSDSLEKSDIKIVPEKTGENSNSVTKTKHVKWSDEDAAVEDGKGITSTENSKHQDGKIILPEISSKWLNMFSDLDDGKEEFVPTTDLEKAQYKVRKFVDNFSVRLFGCVLIVLDIILTIIDLSIKNKPQSTQMFYDAMAMTISIIFMIDLLLRIFGYGPKRFFSNKWEVIDAIIIVVTFTTTVVYTAIDRNIDSSSSTDAADIARLIVLTRALRIVRFVRIFYAHQHVQSSSRRTVSQNKRRYQKDGFDLDLTYVTDRVIAMSFPSSGSTSVFRNPIEEVSRFMKTKHPDSYKIFNLCSERSYDPKWFEGRVSRVLIDDHNVPRLRDLMGFISSAREWMDASEDHIMAIHCKGGKGRTGTIICSWLLEENKFSSAKESLDYFGERRTDLEVADKFQGVETASQIRYVGYFEKIKKEYGGNLPPEKTLHLNTVKIRSIAGVGRGNGSDLSMFIIKDGQEIFYCKFAESINCKMYHNSSENSVLCVLDSCPPLAGDIKIRFTSTCKSLPKGYDNCPFYFWLNTSFVNDGETLRLSRDELDNPHKKKTWHIFQEDFAIELEFK